MRIRIGTRATSRYLFTADVPLLTQCNGNQSIPPPRGTALRDFSSTPAVEHSRSLRVGLIGHGAVGGYVAQKLLHGALPHAELSAVLVRRPPMQNFLEASPTAGVTTCKQRKALLTNDPSKFLAADWDLVVEAAGQEVVRSLVPACLKGGRSVLITSVGAFTDQELHRQLVNTAQEEGGRILIAAGALAGMDWMSAAGIERIDQVRITQIKQPAGWRGTPAEEEFDLATVEREQRAVTVFEGTARLAASLFPKNANIAAALALATAGLDRTKVRLVADPHVPGPRVQIELQGAAGEISIQVQGQPMTGSQRTSMIVPLSVVKALRNLSGPETLGV